MPLQIINTVGGELKKPNMFIVHAESIRAQPCKGVDKSAASQLLMALQSTSINLRCFIFCSAFNGVVATTSTCCSQDPEAQFSFPSDPASIKPPIALLENEIVPFQARSSASQR